MYKGGCRDATWEKAPSLMVGFQHSRLLRWPIEERIDDVESDHAGADHRARGYRPPQYVSARELPDREQTGNDGDDDAGAGSPKRNAGDHARIQEASSATIVRAWWLWIL
jgi:hypothetical protein